MRWLSETCVVLRCDDLINSNYRFFQTIPHQFSVHKPYQAPAVSQAKSSSDVIPSGQEGLPADETRAHESEPSMSAPSEPALEDSDNRPCKRRRKAHSDAQAEGRQEEAQQRHDARQPSLLSAYQLFQHSLQEADSSRAVLHNFQLTDTPAVPGCHTMEDTNIQQADSLDMLALHELKYTLRPKFSVVAEGSHGSPVNLFDNLICNNKDEEQVADAFGHAVLIPAQASFLLSDIKKLSPLLTGLQSFCSRDLVSVLSVHCMLRTPCPLSSINSWHCKAVLSL